VADAQLNRIHKLDEPVPAKGLQWRMEVAQDELFRDLKGMAEKASGEELSLYESPRIVLISKHCSSM
jgi:hypothetical protein